MSKRDDGGLSTAEQRALRLMASVRDYQDGVINQYGLVVCGGEHKSIHPATWLRLISRGLVTGSGRNRLRLTAKGRTCAERTKESKP